MGETVKDYIEYDEEVDGEVPNPVYVIENEEGETAIGKMSTTSKSSVRFDHLDGQDLDDFYIYDGMGLSVDLLSQLDEKNRLHKLDVRGDKVEHVKEVTGV